MQEIFFNRRSALSFWRLVIGLGMIFGSLGSTIPAYSQESDHEIEVFDVLQQDLNRDGKPDLATIECSFITNHDRVLVYDHGKDMKLSKDWRVATDFKNDLWLFDAAADGQIELAIDFRQRKEDIIAMLWDDQDGDGTVQFRPAPNPKVTESENPTVRVIALNSWWIRDGITNFDLNLLVDGRVQASMSSKALLEQRLVKTDRKTDFSIQVRDTDDDGRPDYQWVDVWPRAPKDSGIRRTEIAVNPSDDEPAIKGGIFWPFLGSTFDWDEQRLDRPARLPADSLHIVQQRSGYNKNYNVSMPPIQMLWDKGLLLYVGEFVASRFNDDTWFVYSTNRVEPNKISSVNFEAPFAFYDLAADNDGYPELSIRFEQYLERDMFPFRGSNSEPVQIIRYSWDQDNNLSWDYKLGLIGRHPITDTVSLSSNLELRMIPPSILPNWVTERAWDGATFVVAEDRERWTSEGIYEWGPIGYWRDQYVTGLSDIRPSIDNLGEEFVDLTVGQRGEYTFDLHRQPTLYLSPVDRKLHLLGSEGGRWIIDETREIRYTNLGGEFLNQWELIENGYPVKSIYSLPGYLVYQNLFTVQFARIDQAPALFQVAPPTNNEERLMLEQQMQQYQKEFEPGDFDSIFAQYGDPQGVLKGAFISDLRLSEKGFRFNLEVMPGFEAVGITGPGIDTLEPGKFVVEYQAGSFHFMPLTPPDLSLSIRIHSTDDLLVGLPVTILTEARNTGLSDSSNLILIVKAQQGETEAEIARKQVKVLSGNPTHLTFQWTPSVQGDWDISAQLIDPAEEILIAEDRQAYQFVRSTQDPARVFMLSVGGLTQLFPLIIGLAALFTITVGILLLTVRTGAKRDVHSTRER